jgi:hypothetical protein
MCDHTNEDEDFFNRPATTSEKGWLAVYVLVVALLLAGTFFASCTNAPVAQQPTAPSLAWTGYLARNGQPGEHGTAYARVLWLSYLKSYGNLIQPANPDPNDGWVQLPDGSWWVAFPQVVEWNDLKNLSEIK